MYFTYNSYTVVQGTYNAMKDMVCNKTVSAIQCSCHRFLSLFMCSQLSTKLMSYNIAEPNTFTRVINDPSQFTGYAAAGCKESRRFYSLPFGQAVASMSGKLKTEFTSPIAKSRHQPRAIRHHFLWTLCSQIQ